MIPKPDILYGNGTIDGEIVWCPDTDMHFYSGQLQNIEVILYDAQNIPVDYTRTNLQGYFSFSSVPYGNYKLIADLTGYYTNEAFASLTINNNYVYVEVEICNNPLTSYDDFQTEGNHGAIRKIYPNPFQEKIFIEFNTDRPDNIVLRISDVSGRKIIEQKLVSVDNNRVEVSTQNLKQGIYILGLCLADGSVIGSEKVIKTK
jgi:hypothetical protein